MAETDRFAIGLEYEMEVTFTQLIAKDESDKPVVTDKTFLDKVFVSYIDSGPMDLIIVNERTGDEEIRTVRSDYGIPLGEYLIGTSLPLDRVYTETGRRLILARGRSEDIKLKLRTTSHLGTRLSAILREGTIN